MYSSQFDGVSLFSGGDFTPSQSTQSNELGFSSAKTRVSQRLLPMTVKQMNDGDQSSDDSIDVNNVTLVGMVINKVEKVTDVNFILDDGTGRVDIHRWVNDESNEMAVVMNGMYVRVNGQLKEFQGKKQITAFSVRPVTDFNEIAYHFIECVYMHQYNARFQKLQNADSGLSHVSSGVTTLSQNGTVGHQAALTSQFSGHTVDGGNDFDQMVLSIFHEPENIAKESGVHVDKIVEQLGVPRNKVMASINYHTDNGNIYSTIDDYHYKSTIIG